MAEKINIQGLEIAIKQVNEEDYLSITDLARKNTEREPSEVIRSWIRNTDTILFLEAWEEMHNPDFKPGQMDRFKNRSMNRRLDVSPQKYIELTQAIGIVSRSGRYGGTFAHVDIALEFASWLEPVFRLYVWKDYQRLKSEEAKRLGKEWSTARFLSKTNYEIHTSAIKEHLLPRVENAEPHVYASEADMLNKVVFGMTAKEWRESFPDQAKRGNIRDFATKEQLIVLANMESLNAYLIDAGANQGARYDRLHHAAAREMAVLQNKTLLLDD